MSRHRIECTVNGEPCSVDVPARRLLSDFLRDDLHLTGTKRGCETGVCGACSVLLDGEVVKSCLLLAVQVQGRALTTIEGLADRIAGGAGADPSQRLHPLQQSFMQCGGLQCGYCTPGFIMAACDLLGRNPFPARTKFAMASTATCAVARATPRSWNRSLWPRRKCMEIEKTLTVSASRERVWALLLDPQVMGGAVPGMQSIEVVSPTEYVAVMHQKISFISARFKLRTRIVEQRAPEYLRVEGTGEDTSVASSLKQRSEIFLSATPDGGTELRIKIDVDLLGRLGAFGLSVMKTKADRIWEEFGNNLAARLEGGGGEPAAGKATMQAPAPVAPAPASEPAGETVVQARNSPAPAPASELSSTAQDLRGRGWWGRLIGSLSGEGSAGAADTIHVELRRGDTTVSVQWPGARAEQCAAWLRDCLR